VENGRTYWYQLESVDFQGGTERHGPVSATPMASPLDEETLPTTCRLLANYPNPFNPRTWISYQLPEQGPVSITIYNVHGQLIATLVDKEQPPGSYRVQWDGRGPGGMPAASGVYFCLLQSGSRVETSKMILLR
jgi:hypothetical protein